jgi:Domain of unknown function (DUF4386)
MPTPQSQLSGAPTDLQQYARLAGAMYLITMATALFAEGFVRGSLYASHSAALTAQNLIASNQLFRAALVADLLTFSGVVVLVWALFQLLRQVHRDLAVLAAFFRLVEIGVHLSALAFGAAALSLLARGEYTLGFQEQQLYGLVGMALRAQGAGLSLGFIPLGLGSAVFAYLLLRSGFVPRALAAWGIFASLLLATYSFGVVLFPATTDFFYVAMIPMFFYEVGLGLWLLVKGVNVQRSAA